MHDAFISYRRADGARIAQRLRRRLLEYKLPPSVADKVPPRELSIYLDTIYERASEDFFAKTIAPALDNSRWLIVVRTRRTLLPRSDGQKNWVVREIEHFRRHDGPSRDNVAVAIADGELPDPLPADLDADLPNVERVDVRRMFPFNIGAHDEVLHFVAALYDVPAQLMPILRQEESRRRAARLTSWLVGAMLIVAALALALWQAIVATGDARRSAAEARRTLAASDYRQAVTVMEKPLRLAHLARALRFDPGNAGARAMAMELLSRHSWPRPIAERQYDGLVRLALSPDGNMVIVWRENGAVRVLDADTLAERVHLEMGAHVFGAEIHPDGRRLLVASDQDTGIWDIPSGRLLRRINTVDTTVPVASFSHDGRRYATGDMSLRREIRETDSGAVVHSLATGQRIVFSNDGEWLVTTADDGLSAEVRRVDDRNAPPCRMRATAIYGIASTAGVTRVLTISNNLTAAIWDPQSCKQVSAPMQHPKDVRLAVLSSRGTVATAADDDAARLWDSDGRLIATLQHGDTVESVAFSRDGALVVTASGDQTVRLWDTVTGLPVVQPLLCARGATGAEILPDGNRVVTASVDGAVRVWDVRPAAARPVVLKHADSAVTARFLADDRLVVVAREAIHQWDTRTGRPLRPPIPTAWTRIAYVAPDGRLAATVDQDEHARAWDLATGLPIDGARPHPDLVSAMLFAPDGALVTGSYDGFARVWKGTAPAVQLGRRDDTNYALALSPDQKTLLQGTSGRVVRAYDLTTLKLAAPPVRVSGSVSDIHFSADGTRMIIVHGGGVAVRTADSFWPLPAGEIRHNGDAVPTSDGRNIATGGTDYIIRLWDVATGAERSRMAHAEMLFGIEFASDDRRILTRAGSTCVWDSWNGFLLGEYPFSTNFGFATFNRSASRIAIGNNEDGETEVWDVMAGTEAGSERLASLAEAIGGLRLNDNGVPGAVRDRAPVLDLLRNETSAAPRADTTDWFVRWFVDEVSTRSRSPLARIR